MGKKSKHGGKREGAGRPPLTEGKPKRKRFPMATDEIWEYVTKLGKGNASKGIEILVARDIERTNGLEKAYGLENDQ